MKKSVRALIGSFLAVTICMNSPGTAMAVPISKQIEYVQKQRAIEEEKAGEENFAEEQAAEEEYKEDKEDYASASEIKRKTARVTAEVDENSSYNITEDGILTGYRNSGSVIQIPNNVVIIKEKVFEGNDKVRKVIIPEGVKEIKYGAFAKCENLEEVILPKSLTKLGTGSFYQCTSLKELHVTGNWEPIYTHLVDGTTYDSQGPFSGCSSLKKVDFDKGVTEVPVSLFQGCDGIEEIDLTGIKKLGGSAFKDCIKLKKVTLDPELTADFSTTFENCKELTSINIPKGIIVTLNRGKGPFSGCPKLSDVTIEKDTTRIPAYLFLGCTALKTMDLSGIESIGKDAFKGCENFVGQITSDGKEELNLKNIKYIDEDAFAGCTSLKKIVMGRNLRRLEANSLSAPNLIEVRFDSSYYSKESISNSTIFERNTSLMAYIYEDTSIYQYIKSWNDKHEDKIKFTLLNDGKTNFRMSRDNWSIANNWSIARDFEQIDENSRPIIPISTFKKVMGSNEVTKSFYEKKREFFGYCVGFTETAKIFSENHELFKERFGQNDSIDNVYDVDDKKESYTFKRGLKSYKPTATDLMEYFSISQFRSDSPLNHITENFKKYGGDVDRYNKEQIKDIIDELDKHNLVCINIRKWFKEKSEEDSHYAGHLVLAYDMEDLDSNEISKYLGFKDSKDSEEIDKEWGTKLNKDEVIGKRILIYDSLYPTPLTGMRQILLFKAGETWIWKYTAPEAEFDSGNYYEYNSKDYITYVQPIFTINDFEDWFSGKKTKQPEKKLLLDIKGSICKLKNLDKDTKISFIDSYLDSVNIICDAGTENPYKDFYYIPNGVYTFTTDSGNKLNLKLSADNFSADIQEAEAESATISLNDEVVEENWVILDAASGKTVDIAFHSSHDNKNFDEISIKGKGNKEQVKYTLNADGNEVHVDGVTLEQIQIIVNEDTEEEKVINLPIKNDNENIHTVKVSSEGGKTNIQVLNEKNQVIASTDGNGSSSGGNEGDNTGGNQGGSTGGNEGGSSEGNEGGSSEGNEGGSTGGNEGGSTGGNQGGSTGGNEGGNTGGNQGGNTSGSSGSGSGGSSGGGSGSRRSSGGGSSSSARNGLFITKPSYYGTGTWEANEASTAWKLKTADGTALALQWGLIDNIWYLFGMDGYTCTGWQLVNNQWYYFQPNAMMQTGWIFLNNHWYYLDSTGAMQTGWILLNGRWYYLDNTGAMQTGWLSYNNQWYYLNMDGSMLVNDSTPDGYTVGADGVWLQ